MTILTYPTLPGLAPPLKRSAQMESIRHRSKSGKKTVLPQQTVPIWTWELPYNFLRTALWSNAISYDELDQLIGFFNARSADGMIFRYNDPDDGSVTAQTFGTGDGASTQFQLYRAFGGYVEPVFDGANVTEIDLNGAPLVPVTDYSVSALGVVTFTAAPAAAATLAWTGTFGWLVRFEDDTVDVNRVMRGLYEGAAAIHFSNEIWPS